ncbi:putative ensconsin-like [Cocos nucifera]|uniref:Putative ensconsin-like n=1 Tax=Cocos nucifera TaxID=13894 RepID=A0A8K0INC8_COCNU|nr:putative ensconsin-like [Cocos nucifera]
MIGEPSKRAKVNATSFAMPVDAATNAPATTTTTEVAAPLTSANFSARVQTFEPPIEREEEAEKKKKKKSAIAKVRHKTSSTGSNGSDEILEENPFNNREIIKKLIDGCTLSKVMDRIVDVNFE